MFAWIAANWRLRRVLKQNPASHGDTEGQRLRRAVAEKLWRPFIMSVTMEKLTEEFQTYLNLDGTAKSKEDAAAAADSALQNTIDEENAKISIVQAAADQAVAAKQTAKDAADLEATKARDLATAQKFYFGGLLGLTPETDDPTPTPAPPVVEGFAAKFQPSRN